MKYENGKDIFPERLLKQIQKYASGKLVYIPSAEKKKDWGETTGYRKYLLKRNHDMRLKFRMVLQLSNYRMNILSHMKLSERLYIQKRRYL